MLPENPFLLTADAQDRVAGSLVQLIGFQHHTDASQRLEGVLRHQILRLRVNYGSLPRARDPGSAYLHVLVRLVNIHVAGAAYHPARASFDSRKGQCGSIGLALERGPNIIRHIVPIPHLDRNPAPEVLVDTDLAQGIEMAFGQRLDPDTRTFEHDRIPTNSGSRQAIPL